MPFVFKVSLALLGSALVGGQMLQSMPLAKSTVAGAVALRATCPAMQFTDKVVTIGDLAHLIDAYASRAVGGALGANSGCK